MKTLLRILVFFLLGLCDAFYVPVATSVSVSKIAKSVKLSDSTVVVSRNSTGHPVAFHDYCPHRGASFNNVVLKDDKVACPYHGFEFDVCDDGKLAKGLGVKPGCSSLRMVDCVDSHGLVWACVDGDNELKPPPELVQAADPTFRKISGSVTIKCPVDQLVANVLCSLHVGHVHSFGNSVEPEPIMYKAHKVSPTHGSATFKYSAGDGSMFQGILSVYNWYHVPCTAGTMVTSGNDVKVVQVHAVQLPDGRTKVFWDLYRNWATHPLMDVVFETVMKVTLNEDKEILESCCFENGDQFHGKYDKLQMLYRVSMENL